MNLRIVYLYFFVKIKKGKSKNRGKWSFCAIDRFYADDDENEKGGVMLLNSYLAPADAIIFYRWSYVFVCIN